MRVSVCIGVAALLLVSACGDGGEEANNSMAGNEALAIETQDVTDASADSLVAVDDDGTGNGEAAAEDVANTGDLPATDTNGQ